MRERTARFVQAEIHRGVGVFSHPTEANRQDSFFPVKIMWAYIAPVDKIVSQLDNICV